MIADAWKRPSKHPHYKAPLGKNQGRGIACGFWFNFGGQTCVSLNINVDGTVGVAVGTPDIGGSRASMCLMAAEELGIPYDKVRAIVADTSSLGYNDITDGSRTTFSTGMATIDGRARRDRQALRAAPPRSGASRRKPWSGRTAMPSRPAPMPATSRRCP